MSRNEPPEESSPFPLVSVVVPLYNAERWIGETVESVRAQTYPHDRIEVVLVDDGSTDEGVDRAESMLCGGSIDFQMLRLENGGPSRARNAGWRAASGEWIQFLDADDLLHASKIQTQVAEATGLPPDVAVVYSGWQRYGRVENPLRDAPTGSEAGWQLVGEPVWPRLGTDLVAELLHTENFLQVGSYLVRRVWLERVGGFDERLWLIEDVDLLLRLAMAGAGVRPVPSASPLLYYRQHDESLSRLDSRAFVDGCMRNTRLAEAHWRATNALTPERARTLAHLYYQGARYYASSDPVEHDALVRRIESFVPGFIPAEPRRLRWLSRVVGYRRAEQLALRYRRLKHG